MLHPPAGVALMSFRGHSSQLPCFSIMDFFISQYP